MNNANIGSASNVIGNPVNLIMSNATEEQLKKYDGNLGLPSNSLVIVNPLNNNTNIDSTWNDICITDNNNGIKHIIPFTSIDKSQMYVETSDSGERTLHTYFPATSIDDTVFTYEKGVLSFKGLENLDSKISDFNNKIQGIVSNAEQTIDDYNTVATKYKTLIDSINSLAEQDDIVTQIENKAESIKKTIDDINDYTVNNDIQSKITDINNNIDKLTSKQKEIKDQINEIQPLISNFIPDSNGESEVLKNINDTVNKTNEALEQSKNEFEQYKNVVDNLVDNTKDELHREYEALKNSLNDCVNNNLLPLVEAQVDTCLANDKVAEMFDGAVEKILTEQDTKAEAGILNSVSRALNGEGNATTVNEASNNLNSAINTIVKDRSSVAISEFSETVSKAIQPKYVDKRYFDVIQLSEVDSNAPDNEKKYTVITLSKPLRDFFKNQLGESAFSSLHGALQF